MLVSVDMIEDEPRLGECLELGVDLGPELSARFGIEEPAHPCPEQAVAKAAIASDKRRYARRRQNRTSIGQSQMKPDREAGHPPGARNRVVGRIAADHQ